MLAVSLPCLVVFVIIAVFAVVVGVAGKQFPVIGQITRNFRIQASADHSAGVDIVAVAHSVISAINGAVFLIDLEQGDGSVQAFVVPSGFPADFVVGADNGR